MLKSVNNTTQTDDNDVGTLDVDVRASSRRRSAAAGTCAVQRHLRRRVHRCRATAMSDTAIITSRRTTLADDQC